MRRTWLIVSEAASFAGFVITLASTPSWWSLLVFAWCLLLAYAIYRDTKESKPKHPVVPVPSIAQLPICRWRLDTYWQQFVDTKEFTETAHLYREAVEHLQRGQLSKVSTTNQALIANAVRRWVSMAYYTLATSHPSVEQPNARQDTIDRLYLLAWKNLGKGKIVDFATQTSIRDACIDLSKSVESFVRDAKLDE